MAILTANNVSKHFASQTALNKVSIEVPPQSIFGLLGPNGAGKTTLIRIINQITGPDEGEVLLENRKLKPDDVYSIGYLPEERGLYKKMAVGEQALYLAQLKGMSHHDATQKLKYWFRKFEIESWWGKKVEELSKGMQQKVQFIVTVVHEPKLLIFDEPFSGFDPINVNLLKDEILELRRKGSTIIFSTHNMASVEELCDNIALINKANKILDGSVKEIKKQNRTNTFELHYREFDGDLRSVLNADFSLIEARHEDGIHTAIVKLPSEAGSNDLLANVMPHAVITGLSEIVPSMNDIFISTVNDFNEGNANDLLAN
jgi:ABC-2 type transport system ATP-binding protein